MPARRRVNSEQVPPGDFATLQCMNLHVLLEPLSYLRHASDQGFSDSPQALIFKGYSAAVRFDKVSGELSLDPPSADLLGVLQELQPLASLQEREERVVMLTRLARRPF